MSELKTIRATAELGILPEHRLREMLKQGRLPGIYHGRKFLVNLPLLAAQIEQESLKNSHRYDGAAD